MLYKQLAKTGTHSRSDIVFYKYSSLNEQKNQSRNARGRDNNSVSSDKHQGRSTQLVNIMGTIGVIKKEKCLA